MIRTRCDRMEDIWTSCDSDVLLREKEEFQHFPLRSELLPLSLKETNSLALSV